MERKSGQADIVGAERGDLSVENAVITVNAENDSDSVIRVGGFLATHVGLSLVVIAVVADSKEIFTAGSIIASSGFGAWVFGITGRYTSKNLQD